MVNGQDVRIVCKSNDPIIISYTNSSSEVTIGGCSAFKDCHTEFPDKYAVNGTGDVGILTIYKLDVGKYGVYTCTNALNTSCKESVNVTLNAQHTTTPHQTSGYYTPCIRGKVVIYTCVAMAVCFGFEL
ncbi:hypothetical protein DPMN_039183 [Dreissena polymorpha]|uniref:Uncharacterized protein n=1 Tax=Dreissena polymorpha TaxID=45954 RepID=A0A9D4MGR0_DREPO|nr:hypothetical protein DPMN_039183 [Dreissena polymorpha]